MGENERVAENVEKIMLLTTELLGKDEIFGMKKKVIKRMNN